MKYGIDRQAEREGRIPRLVLTPESPKEATEILKMEKDLDSQFGRGRYILEVDGVDGGCLIYRIVRRDGRPSWLDAGW